MTKMAIWEGFRAWLRGADLDLQRLHDQVWANGNVPIALLRWELLGLTDELAALDIDAG